MKKLFRALPLLFLCSASLVRAQQSATTAPQEPIKIELSQKADTPPNWVTFAGEIAWPTVAVLGLIALYKPISRFLDAIGQRATKISIWTLGVELPTMNQAQLGEDVLTFRTEDPVMIVSSSAKRSLFEMFGQPGKFEFVAINLSRGQSWLSSRLFIFAMMLQRMKSLRCIVFLGAGQEQQRLWIELLTRFLPDRATVEEVLQVFQGAVLAFLITGDREPGRRAVMRILENQEKVRSRA